MKNYGEELKYQREIRNLSQTQLARQTNISQQLISYWERNVYIPSVENCEKLADFYEISIDELIGRDKNERPISHHNTYNNNGIHNGDVKF